MKAFRSIGEDEKPPINDEPLNGVGYYDNPALEAEPGTPETDPSFQMTVDDGPEKAADEYPQQRRYEEFILGIQSSIAKWYTAHKKTFWTCVGLIFGILWFIYFGFAMEHKFGDEGSWRLLGVSLFAVLLISFNKLTSAYESEINAWKDNNKNIGNSKWAKRGGPFMRWFLRVGVLLAVVIYVIIDIAIERPSNLISVAGLLIYIILFYLTSVNPTKVNWHTVFWGIAMQYVFALLILRTQWGYEMFKWLGDRVTEFLEHTMAGVLFVFGDTYYQHFFAFKVLSIVAFFFMTINILYYLGVMQAVIKVLGRFLAFCMGTTPAESINAAANIFVSMTESPLMIKPFLDGMTKSELHAVMTGGFATIAGSVLGAYISFGVPANHLISASVMSAPAALAISKLSYPEVEVTKSSSKDFDKIEKSTEHNIIEAASNGATSSIKIIGAIAVNVIAFLSLLSFLNATLTWLGLRLGYDYITFEWVCSYLLFPISYFMGIETDDCRKVAELIGIKTFTNEFIAYGKLKDLIANDKSLTNYTNFYNTTDWYWRKGDIILPQDGDAILTGGVISEKSVIITTYALCGFANFGSIGITLGGLGALAPRRKPELAQMVVRAMICGNAACFLTACIAGLFYKPF